MHELDTMSSIGRRAIIACLARKNMIFAGVSNAVRDDMRKDLWFIPKERIVTLYNCIDIDAAEPALLTRSEARRQLGLSDHDFIIGNIARLAPNKDHESLIQAFALLQKECAHAKLVIIGDGELEQPLTALVKSLSLESSVIFTGFLPNGFRYMPAFDCFALSSTQEAFGRVLIEAMIAKLPIVATRVHGIPEVLGDIGVMIQPRDVHNLAITFKHIYALEPEERKQFGHLAYQHVTKHFSIPSFQHVFWKLPIIATLRNS
jgi:glycosyltransferase involved in cell wall biosynthesis